MPVKSFSDKLAVVSGGGSGMGRQLVAQLASKGCSVAFCDVRADSLADTLRIARAAAAPGTRITGHAADVSREEDWLRFRAEALAEHGAKCVHLLFLNAGIGGGASMFSTPREEWERCFGISWFGTYYGVRTFLELLAAAPEAHVVCTSSSAVFWPTTTAYTSAKAAVKSFAESLAADCRLHAPHVGTSVVLPGHVATSIPANTALLQGKGTADGAGFAESAPTSAEEAARIILEGVLAGKSRILVGHDAEELDRMAREDPDGVSGKAFARRVRERGIFGGAIGAGRKGAKI
ncbi:short-chain alcohol dehydrogenase [Hyaloraphidium curvatum]|nr:short-chain alcohol dehydrogenase [Hyaloraphidium curvatum]